MDIATAPAINLSKHMAIVGMVQYSNLDLPTYYCMSHTLLQGWGGGGEGGFWATRKQLSYASATVLINWIQDVDSGCWLDRNNDHHHHHL